MSKVEYLIVGQGIAGSCLALKLIKENKSFLVIDEDKNKASTVAVGIFNTVVLKRFALIWDADEQLKLLYKYFGDFERLLDEELIVRIPTYRIFNNHNEIETWQKKSKREELTPYIKDEIILKQNPEIDTPFGYAEVMNTGRIKLEECLNSFKKHLTTQGLYLNQRFDYSQLKTNEKEIIYKDITAERIVFCEGYGIKSNPYFNYLPVIGVKGEVLKIKTSSIVPRAIWKAFNFLMPEEDHICYTASTYDRDELSPEPSEKGKQEIQLHLEEFYKGEYEIIDHTAGIRPTVIDRRPLVGDHPELKNVYILNGMGTRGTLLAPRMTEFLWDFIENNKPIDKEADIRRFDHLKS